MKERGSRVRTSEEKAVILVGPPNSGKTTLFNRLTHSHFEVVNYPGSTVDYSVGEVQGLKVYDTPGVYSLEPTSPDEEVTLHVLESFPEAPIILVLDATQYLRQVHLLRQVLSKGRSVLLVLTMNDILLKHGIRLHKDHLEKQLGIPVFLFDGTKGEGIEGIFEALQQAQPLALQVSREEWDKKNKALWQQVCGEKWDEWQLREKTDRWDQVLLHPFWGLVAFVLIMMVFFSSIFWLAQPFMDFVDLGFAFLAEKVSQWGGSSLWSLFLADGLIGGMGAVFVFVPQIFILFLGIGFLEDSGYLARAATIIDKPLSYLGLSGRSFVPLLSGFACAVPAILSSRSLKSRKERWIAVSIIPFMTCSARLPVYALLLSFLFMGDAAWKPGLALLGIYVFSIVLGGIAAFILNKLLKVSEESFFTMDLPLYRKPVLQVLLKTALLRTQAYIKKAGPMIFILSVLIWAASHFPYYKDLSTSEQVQKSVAGQVGQVLEPIFEPMGGDWRVGVGLMSAFAAREVFVSSLAIMFNVTEDVEEEGVRNSLLAKMKQAKNLQGEPVFTLSSVLGLILFFMIALQCVSTSTVVAKEMNSLKFALYQVISMNIIAYILTVALVQGLRTLGVP
ncbi:MAG: ferrous iron transporter B [Bdellovibrio sp.]|nr:MAG: ferrous iron transporter B [Bdellovibrio sp.]